MFWVRSERKPVVRVGKVKLLSCHRAFEGARVDPHKRHTVVGAKGLQGVADIAACHQVAQAGGHHSDEVEVVIHVVVAVRQRPACVRDRGRVYDG